MTIKVYCTASICHSDDNYRNATHRRVKLRLVKLDNEFEWIDDTNESLADYIGMHSNVTDSINALKTYYKYKDWNLIISRKYLEV